MFSQWLHPCLSSSDSEEYGTADGLGGSARDPLPGRGWAIGCTHMQSLYEPFPGPQVRPRLSQFLGLLRELGFKPISLNRISFLWAPLLRGRKEDSSGDRAETAKDWAVDVLYVTQKGQWVRVHGRMLGSLAKQTLNGNGPKGGVSHQRFSTCGSSLALRLDWEVPPIHPKFSALSKYFLTPHIHCLSP